MKHASRSPNVTHLAFAPNDLPRREERPAVSAAQR